MRILRGLSRGGAWTRTIRSAAALAVMAGAAACVDGGGVEPEGPYEVTFSGGAGFAAAHAGQPIRAALVIPAPLQVVSVKTGQVTDGDPTFTFQFGGLQPGRAYAIDYWIDSDLGGGLRGVCDDPSVDHQWRHPLASVTADTQVTATHDPAAAVDVCDAFASTLTFRGEAEFGLAHENQAVELAVIRSSDDAVVGLATGTTASGADPAFEFVFEHLLLNGDAYHIHYWIDSNYNGGSAGECDPPPFDHQWVQLLGAVDRDTVLVGIHNTDFTDVCATFDG